jgi:hypothetical protein
MVTGGCIKEKKKEEVYINDRKSPHSGKIKIYMITEIEREKNNK